VFVSIFRDSIPKPLKQFGQYSSLSHIAVSLFPVHHTPHHPFLICSNVAKLLQEPKLIKCVLKSK